VVGNCDLEYVMSRSYRRPYAAITGLASAKDDKRMAHRGVRRKQNLALKTSTDYENLPLPHRLEWPGTTRIPGVPTAASLQIATALEPLAKLRLLSAVTLSAVQQL
jgi:hypothetical protein